MNLHLGSLPPEVDLALRGYQYMEEDTCDTVREASWFWVFELDGEFEADFDEDSPNDVAIAAIEIMYKTYISDDWRVPTSDNFRTEFAGCRCQFLRWPEADLLEYGVPDLYSCYSREALVSFELNMTTLPELETFIRTLARNWEPNGRIDATPDPEIAEAVEGWESDLWFAVFVPTSSEYRLAQVIERSSCDSSEEERKKLKMHIMGSSDFSHIQVLQQHIILSASVFGVPMKVVTSIEPKETIEEIEEELGKQSKISRHAPPTEADLKRAGIEKDQAENLRAKKMGWIPPNERGADWKPVIPPDDPKDV